MFNTLIEVLQRFKINYHDQYLYTTYTVVAIKDLNLFKCIFSNFFKVNFSTVFTVFDNLVNTK